MGLLKLTLFALINPTAIYWSIKYSNKKLIPFNLTMLINIVFSSVKQYNLINYTYIYYKDILIICKSD